MSDPWIVIGTVTSVNPAKRELRVDAVPRHAHEFEARERIRVRLSGGTLRECRVAAVMLTDHGHVVTLNPGTTRDTVAVLRGAEVVLAPEEQTPRPEGEYTLEELVGFEVMSDDGMIGVVVDAFKTPANDILEIETSAGARMLAPLVEELIRDVDLDSRRIHMGDITPFAVVEDDEGADDED